jgi:hypothetical protein
MLHVLEHAVLNFATEIVSIVKDETQKESYLLCSQQTAEDAV